MEKVRGNSLFNLLTDYEADMGNFVRAIEVPVDSNELLVGRKLSVEDSLLSAKISSMGLGHGLHHSQVLTLWGKLDTSWQSPTFALLDLDLTNLAVFEADRVMSFTVKCLEMMLWEFSIWKFLVDVNMWLKSSEVSLLRGLLEAN